MVACLAVDQECGCGCGERIPLADRRGRPRQYVVGHAKRGRVGWWRTEDPSPRLGRERATRIVRSRACSLLTIGGCGERIEVHHVDEDPTNNDRANLLVLCATHHRLVHQGRIDLENPVMPPYYVDGSGKRRYAHSGYALPDERRSRSEASRAREERKRQNAGT